jgi:hypothetical protein
VRASEFSILVYVMLLTHMYINMHSCGGSVIADSRDAITTHLTPLNHSEMAKQ